MVETCSRHQPAALFFITEPDSLVDLHSWLIDTNQQ